MFSELELAVTLSQKREALRPLLGPSTTDDVGLEVEYGIAVMWDLLANHIALRSQRLLSGSAQQGDTFGVLHPPLLQRCVQPEPSLLDVLDSIMASEDEVSAWFDQEAAAGEVSVPLVEAPQLLPVSASQTRDIRLLPPGEQLRIRGSRPVVPAATASPITPPSGVVSEYVVCLLHNKSRLRGFMWANGAAGYQCYPQSPCNPSGWCWDHNKFRDPAALVRNSEGWDVCAQSDRCDRDRWAASSWSQYQ